MALWTYNIDTKSVKTFTDRLLLVQNMYTLIILVVKSLDIHDFTIFETILCIMPRIFLVKPKSIDQHSFIIICIVPFSGKAISFYKRSKHDQRLNLRYFFRWLFNSGLDMVCSRIQWIAKIFRFFNNFSLFWTVRSLDISPLMRFVPFLSGSFASNKILPENVWTM